MPSLLRGWIALALTLTFGAGCSSGPMRPCPETPEDPLCPTTGTAHVVVTGFEQYTFDAPLYPGGEPRPSLLLRAGVVQLLYRNPQLLPTDSLALSGLRLNADAQTAGANILIHGSGYTTPDGCTVTLTAFDERRVAGSFACTGMFPWGLDQSSSRLIDASGSFEAGP
jgi:hypothetical protein